MTSNLPSLLIPDTALSVAGLTAYIQALLEQDNQLRQVWVTGEVSSATRYRSGLFFTLQDPDAEAAISCVVWNNQLNRLATLPAPGEQLIILGRVHVHPQRGSYQLIVWQALPAGEGLRALRYRQLRKRLETEGLFDLDRKRSLPPYPQTIAVVTSPQAAAWGDIKRTLKRRHPGLQVLFSPALVQGEQAPGSIVQAIHRVVRDGRAEVLILSRGGGATEDMVCFNDERVVRAIATCPIPVVAGIGHQRDESLADLVADVCAHTPTAAAEQAVPLLADLYAEHRQRIAQLSQVVTEYLEDASEQLYRLKGRVHRLHLDRQIRQEAQAIAWKRQQLIQSTSRRLQEATQHCQLLRQKLLTLDPAAVLRRGYAVARQTDGSVVRSVEAVTLGQELTVQLAQGQLKVTVNEISSSPAADTPLLDS
ncbi:MAG: exodeoxyribonuclease VII large subunit [Leptolyngbya sp. IPPAS B-1204]|uniref:Exodeoxyribonuclease 7 large subunit n=1 Tax=Leptolyngbya sp. NK1-12 TaxID=2547451 RepID=A0AA97AH03_9CYAN|nr:exodeoxyribonuclease VII large subunit [Leptolyngbya sp. NK1-12]MBF2045870.1 exodeoxyribonuclease VII large subunit [Elainella sp. C42_A2020_010]RNJ68151.1 MAG: exodeoxyribonuclease VII large subunit [Leptolyngbya sp. IPPAS B-1204]WNZ22261.1 exodeoxyribonuclease VII large subunit [Leptolyngbya sp. NK1-12]